MEFRILGPVEVWDQGRRLDLGGPKQRTVLTALLLAAGRVVSVERLIDELWEEPPAGARNAIQRHVSRLRRVLEGDGGAEPGQILITRPPGYLLRVKPDQVDLYRFERLTQQATTALSAGDPDQAAGMLREALALWRGPALADVAEPIRWEAGARLEEARLAAVESRIEADLALGRHADLVSELTALVAAHPLRERLRGQLMVALYQAGRQADALAVYHQGREKLATELGLDPGPELRELERKILTGDPDLLPPAVAETGQVPVPAQLPPDIADFTGRAQHVDAMCDLLAADREERARPTAVVVLAVAGKAGIGKTTLAVHVAHRLRDHFSDGQLYVNLRGAEAQPLDPSEVLARFLRALGVEGAAIPDGVEERAALYRTRLAGRQMLVLLDNAASEAQVRPLLPGSGSCAVVVTSRMRLGGLDSARLVDLDVLTVEQAVELLARVAGSDRVAAEPELAGEIVRLCGYLPLAVRIAGARLAARPHWSLARLAARLADEGRRLDELALGERAVRASLALSYQSLGHDQRCCFRRLGLLVAADFASWVAAALLDMPVSQAEELVDALVDAQLLEFAGQDATGNTRYRFHDLLRVYARERAEAEEPLRERQASLERALGCWLALAERAGQRLSKSLTSLHGPAPRWRLDPEATETLVAHPLSWFEAERAALVAAVQQAHESELHQETWNLAASLVDFCDVRGYWDDWRCTHELALITTRRAGDRTGEAVVLRGLGELHLFQDRYDQALVCFEEASVAFGELGDRRGEAVAESSIGELHRHAGRYEQALTSFQRALAISHEFGNPRCEAHARRGIGAVYRVQGRDDEALACYEQALEISRQVGHRWGEAETLRYLGRLYLEQGHYDQALACFEHLLIIYRELVDHRGEADAWQGLGEIHLRQGHWQQAEVLLDRCLTVYRDLGDRFNEAFTLRTLGELHHTEGRLDQATGCLNESLRIWRQLQIPLWQAKTLTTLGDLHANAEDWTAAHAAWHEALRLFEQLSAPEAKELTARLKHLPLFADDSRTTDLASVY